MPSKLCTYPGCNQISPKTRCDKHRGRKYTKASYAKLYDTARWKRLRKKRLAANPICQCTNNSGKSCGRPGTDVDHIKPHRGDRKLFFDFQNTQSLTHECHTKKTRMGL